MYETESRNSAFKDQGIKSRTCIASADFDAFRDETMARYQTAPQFAKDCRLSDTKRLADGFAFAMACKGVKTILTFHFAKDLVSSTIETLIVDRPNIPRRSSRCRDASASARASCRVKYCSPHAADA
jgi:hypothetical protein